MSRRMVEDLAIGLGLWLFGPLVGMTGYWGINPYAIHGGYVIALGLGAADIWLAVHHWRFPILALLVYALYWAGLAVVAARLWQRWEGAGPLWPDPPKYWPRKWTRRRFAGWWAVVCSALVVLLAVATVARALGGV